MNSAALSWSCLWEAIVTFGQLMQQTMADTNPWDGTTLEDRDPEVINALMPLYNWFYDHYFPATTVGLEHIPEGKALLVGSHNGGLGAPDMFMLMSAWFRQFGTERPAYGLMNPKMWTGYPDLARLAARAGAIQATPRMAIAALRANANVLVYPGGARDVFRHHSLRHRIFLNGNLAFVKLALREQAPIVPVVSVGAHDTLRVIGDLYPLLRRFHQWGMPWLLGVDPEVWPVFLGLPWGIGVGPLLNIPIARPIHLRISAPILLDGGPESAKEQDHVLQCYDQVHRQMQSSLNQLVKEQETLTTAAKITTNSLK